MFTASTIAPIRVVAERKCICRNCPTKDFYRDIQTCLREGKHIDLIVKLKTDTCPKGNW
jgi:hypothetical protein